MNRIVALIFAAAVLAFASVSAHAEDERLLQQMNRVDQLRFETLKAAIEAGEGSKFPPGLTRFCGRCKEYNAATDASNAVMEQELEMIRDRYR